MSIEFPETFGEAFWGPQLRVSKQYDDDAEKSIKPFIHELLGMVSGMEGLPPVIESMLGAIGEPGHFGLKQVGTAVASQASGGVIQEGLTPFMRLLSYAINTVKPTKLIELDNAATLRYRSIMPQELYEEIGKKYGYDPTMAQAIYKSLMPYPTITDVIEYCRYTFGNSSVENDVSHRIDFTGDDFPMWDFQTRLRLTPNEIQQLCVRNAITPDRAREELERLGYYKELTGSVLDLGYSVPNPTILLQSSLFRGEPFDINEKYVEKGGISPEYAPHYIDGVLTRPDPAAIIRYLLRKDPGLGTLDRELRRLGIHPDYFDVYKTLAYPVPPIGDMITMAVREAFTPDIAARFGQYEDYPSELTRFAAMNGIDEEWTRRYWAAHWSLPSPQQGFAMYQRGIIGQDELNLLLRALDIMPFWRNKLTELAYNPLTRVDVRRMYRLGVLTQDGVDKAYRDAGYSPDNAKRLAEFVVRDTVQAQSGLSVSKIVTAYKNGYATRQDAYSAIQNTGVRSDNIDDILNNADRQLGWQRVKDGIAAIRNQYKQELITEGEARNQLSGLRLDGQKIAGLMAQWEADGVKEQKTLWSKADTLAMMKKGIIAEERASKELTALGYNPERATALIRLAGTTEK